MTQVQRGHRVLPEQLRRARASLELSLAAAAELVGVSPDNLASWESGDSSPDDEELWNVAEGYGRPIAYFFTQTPETPTHQDFRSKASVGERERNDAKARRVVVAVFEELCRAQASLESALGRSTALTLQGVKEAASNITHADRLARYVRQAFALGEGPVRDLRGRLEQRGIKVFAVAVGGNGPSGTCWWHPQYGPAILVNRVEGEGRRAFTLAHELAHLLRLRGQPFCDYFNLEVDEERFANRFAACLLMPKEDLHRFVQPLLATEELGGWGTSDETLDRIARHYKASREAVAWRLEELGVLPPGFTNQRRQEWQAGHPPRGAKGKVWRRKVKDLGVPYTSLVREAHDKGMLSLSAVADLLRVDVEQADEWLRGADGG